MQAVVNPQPWSRQATGFGTGAFLYALFVVYGSLVPLAFRYRPLGDAWAVFLEIPYLQLGIGSRADWVANILLYIPLAFLLTGALAQHMRAAGAGVLTFLACAALALAVEFAQLFFPPRTVSLNDIAAELIGTAIGIALFNAAARRLMERLRAVLQGGREAMTAFVGLYTGAYLLFAFFPYDFLVSAAELAQKLASPSGTAIFLAKSCGGALSCTTKLGAEVLMAAPLGAFLAMFAARKRPGFLAAFGWGILLGLVIEGLQTFLASGVSQGASVLTRGVGMALGLAAYRHFDRIWLARYRPHTRIAVLLALPVYAVLLLELVGFFNSRLESATAAASKLSQVRFLPFYYHYFTSETQAMHSVLVHAGAYAPIGLMVWLLGSGKGSRRSLWISGITAFLVAAGMETLKLFLHGRRPDPTDALIAAAAATLACFAAARLAGWSPRRSSGVPSFEKSTPHSHARGFAVAAGLLASGAAVAGWLIAMQPKEHYADESTLPLLGTPGSLPAAQLPGFRMAHPRLPSPSAEEVEILRRHNRGFFSRVQNQARGGHGDLQSAVVQAFLQPGSVDLDLVHGRLMELKFSWRGHSQVQPLAVAYDWLHAQWTAAQREQLAGKLAEGCEYLIEFIRKDRLSPYNAFLYNRPLQALMACSIAVYGEEPRGDAIMAFTYDLWRNRVLPVWRQVMGRNGGWHEGGEYVGIGIGQAIYQLPAMWRRATGEDLFASEPGIRGFLDFLVHRVQPDGTHFRWGDGAWFDRSVPDALPLALEMKHPLAYALQRAAEPPSPSSSPWGPLTHAAGPFGAASSLALARHFDGIGLLVARSAWSEDASYVTFKAGDNYWSHTHLDQGAFTIYKGGPLAIDSGLYGPTYGSDHHMNYSYQTVAHNTVTVTDPRDRVPAPGKERLRPIANDGGQRRVGSGWGVEPAPLDLAEWQAKRQIYETGNIERLLMDDGLVVAVADVTAAYTNARSGKGLFSDRTRRVERFRRAFGYDQVDEVVVVFDQVTSTDASFRKRWLLHMVHEPAVQGDAFSVQFPPQQRPGRSGGRLEGKVLLPKAAVVHAIGGRGLEFFVDDRNYDEGGQLQQMIAKLGPTQGEPGAWRVEVSPSHDARDDVFLVVLIPTNGDKPTHQVKLLETDSSRIGCEVAGPTRITRWWFERSGQAAEVEVITGADSRRHLVKEKVL